MSRVKPNYREILRLSSKGLSQQDIATSVAASKKTVNRILRLAKEHNISWPLPKSQTNDELAKMAKKQTTKALNAVLHEASAAMKNGYNRADN